MNKPAIPPEVANEELTNVDIDEDQVQIVKMVDKDGEKGQAHTNKKRIRQRTLYSPMMTESPSETPH